MSAPTTEFREDLISALGPLRRFALVLTRAEADADDLLQSTCERALGRWDQFQPGTKFQSWLFSIMHSVWKNQVRSQATRARAHEELSHRTAYEDGVRIADGKIAFAEVLSHLKAIDPDQAAAMTLVSLDGLSYRDAAGVLDIPQGTLESRVARGRIALGKRLEAVAPANGKASRPSNDSSRGPELPSTHVATRTMTR